MDGYIKREIKHIYILSQRRLNLWWHMPGKAYKYIIKLFKLCPNIRYTRNYIEAKKTIQTLRIYQKIYEILKELQIITLV